VGCRGGPGPEREALLPVEGRFGVGCSCLRIKEIRIYDAALSLGFLRLFGEAGGLLRRGGRQSRDQEKTHANPKEPQENVTNRKPGALSRLCCFELGLRAIKFPAEPAE